MKIFGISFTKSGAAVLFRLTAALKRQGEDCRGFVQGKFLREEYLQAGLQPLKESVSAWTKRHFPDSDALIFVGAAGIAVRAVSSQLKDKYTDPAVLVIDEQGRFVISLLSGHIGGANALAKRAADVLGAAAVVTTASDGQGLASLDVWAKEHGCVVPDRELLTKVEAALVNGERVGFAVDACLQHMDGACSGDAAGEKNPCLLGEACCQDRMPAPAGFITSGEADYLVLVTARPHPEPGTVLPVRPACAENLLLVHPRILTLGIGCRKGVSAELIRSAVSLTLEQHNLAPAAVSAAASVDLKREEEGLLSWAEDVGLPLSFYSSGELEAVPGCFHESDFVRSIAGTGSVCERAAVKAAGAGGRLLVEKEIHGGVTVAVAEAVREPAVSSAVHKNRLLLFGGTSEGRELAAFASEKQIPVLVSVVSDYGQELVTADDCVQVRVGALDADGLRALLLKENPPLVLDATHPYAKEITAALRALCGELQIRYLRIARGSQETAGGRLPGCYYAEDAGQAAEILSADERPVLLTTGSKELPVFAGEPGLRDRLFVRVLPDEKSLAICRQAGIERSRIIAMQGPFTQELNEALLRASGAGWLVTKDSGVRGGFLEKVRAAENCGVSCIVIRRPGQPDAGVPVAEARRQMLGLRQAVRPPRLRPEPSPRTGKNSAGPCRLYLIGMGMGGGGQLTAEAAKALRESGAVFGAARMLADLRKQGFLDGSVPGLPFYLAEDIFEWLDRHPECRKASAVFSGDTGFFSGAASFFRAREAALRAKAEKMPDTGIYEQAEFRRREFEIRVLPGISSLSALAARFGLSWEDWHPASAHGRDCDLCALLKEYEKVFLLLSPKQDLGFFCKSLSEAGLEKTLVFAGSRLGYTDEKLLRGTAAELSGTAWDGLSCAVFIRQAEPQAAPADSRSYST